MKFLDESVLGKYVIRFQLRNGTNRPRIIWVELWGHDFTLLPLESAEFVTWSNTESPQVEVTEFEDKATLVLSHSTDETTFGDYLVHQGGILLDPGYQRQTGLDAGLSY